MSELTGRKKRGDRMDDLTIEVTVSYTLELNDETINRVLVERRNDGCRDGIFLEDVRKALTEDRKESQGLLAAHLSRGEWDLGEWQFTTLDTSRLYEPVVDPDYFLQCLIQDLANNLDG
jgi:hypothetical protein